MDTMKNVFDPGMVSQATVQLLQDRKLRLGESIKTGIADLDEVLNPLRPGDLIVVLGYTRNYKSGLMNFISSYHAMRLRDSGAMNQAVITFTWEQSIEEQGIIDIAQLTSLDSNRMMRGQLSEDEWNLLLLGAMRRGTLPWWLVGHSACINERRPRLNMSEVAEVLAWIVDYQEIEPVLVGLDYLQRIKRERGDTLREQFIAIVDQAKDLALAFHCPVILGSQAGRTVVNTPSRTWRLPHVDEGQECLAGDVVLVNAKTGDTKSVREWHEKGSDLYLHTMQENWHFCVQKSWPIRLAAIQDIYKILTKDNKFIRVSGNHPFYTPQGWKKADRLKSGDYVAYARCLDVIDAKQLNKSRALILGLLLGDGSYTNGSTPTLSCGHRKEIGDIAARIVREEFNLSTTYNVAKDGNIEVYFTGPQNVGPGKNTLIDWLRKIGLYGQRHNNAEIPQLVFQSSNESIASFLCGLYTADGCYSRPSKKITSPVISFCSASILMARQVVDLLFKLGIHSSSRIQLPGKRTVLPMNIINITAMEKIGAFINIVDFLPTKQKKARERFDIAVSLRSKSKIKLRSSETLPPEISLEFIEMVKKYHMRARYAMVKGRGISYSKAICAAQEMGENHWPERLNGDIVWVRGEEVILDGREQTYDISIPPEHNFIANGFVVHNTSNLEQSADKLISVWMPKNDNPTGTVLEYANKTYRVTDNLLILGVMKQKFGPSPRVMELTVYPETNDITCVKTIELNHYASD